MAGKNKCKSCGEEKDIELFGKNKSVCKKCLSKKANEVYHSKPKTKASPERLAQIYKWQKENKDKRKQYTANYHESHKEKEKAYYEENSEKIIARQKKHREDNKDKYNEELSERRKDPIIKLRHRVSCFIRECMNGKKGKSCLKYFGYTIEELKYHLESLFESWMNWENWGEYSKETWNDDDQETWKWQLDHIIPQADLPYDSMEHDNFKKCWDLSNLRPLSAKQNIIKGTRRVRHKKKE